MEWFRLPHKVFEFLSILQNFAIQEDQSKNEQLVSIQATLNMRLDGQINLQNRLRHFKFSNNN